MGPGQAGRSGNLASPSGPETSSRVWAGPGRAVALSRLRDRSKTTAVGRPARDLEYAISNTVTVRVTMYSVPGAELMDRGPPGPSQVGDDESCHTVAVISAWPSRQPRSGRQKLQPKQALPSFVHQLTFSKICVNKRSYYDIYIQKQKIQTIWR